MSYPQKLNIAGSSYEVIYQSVLKPTSSVRIKNGAVVLRLSRFVQGEQRDQMIEKFLKWAERRLKKIRKPDFINPVYENGGRVVTHNKIYEIGVKFVNSEKSKVFLRSGSLLEFKISSLLSQKETKKKIKFLAEDLIIRDQTSYLREVLDELNQLYFQEEFNSCRFKRVASRFGSCSSKRNINIALRLLFAPREVFRYVCVHELAHLKEFNHSARFWALVEGAMPDYKDSEKWLRNNGFLLG